MASRRVPVLWRGEGGLKLSLFPWGHLPREGVLAGLFSREAEEGGLLPSPTLLLNLPFFKPEDLFKLALAEKARFEENVYKSYLLDTRAETTAVFSREPDKLSAFLEAYGGLFKARAFSLKRDRRFPLIEDLEIVEAEGGFELSYLRFAPFDVEKCSRCALCARLCPQGAIGPELVIDPARCDGCRKCEKACPEGALDLSRFERVEEKVRFLLFLEEVPEGVPQRPGLVFSGDELYAFLAQLGAFEVVESLRLSGARCHYAPRFEAGCKLCFSVCPREALKVTPEGLLIEHFLCKDCGRCVSSCPTGALEYTLLDDRGFSAYLSALPDLSGRVVVIGREEALEELFWSPHFPEEGPFFFLAHQAPKGLHLAQILSFFVRGARMVAFLGKAPKVVGLSNELLEALFGKQPILVVEDREIPSLPAREGLEVALEELPPFKSRRRWLSALLFTLWETAGRPSLSLSAEGFGRLVFDEQACTLCLACLNECREEALKADPENYALTYEPGLCVACGLCVRVCPEGALRLEEGLFLEEAFFRRRVLARDEPLYCRRCGKVFGTRKSQKKVREVLSSLGRFAEVLEVLDLCEDCRVKELFEKGG